MTPPRWQASSARSAVAARLVVALLALALLAPAALAQATQWEYAALVFDGQSQADWVSPDGNVSRTTMAATASEVAEMYDAPLETSMGSLLRILNAAGHGGWELVAVDRGSYILKRPAQ